MSFATKTAIESGPLHVHCRAHRVARSRTAEVDFHDLVPSTNH